MQCLIEKKNEGTSYGQKRGRNDDFLVILRDEGAPENLKFCEQGWWASLHAIIPLKYIIFTKKIMYKKKLKGC